MDPYYEQRLRDEVIYLHSLWHLGPPPTNPTPTPNPNPNPNPTPNFINPNPNHNPNFIYPNQNIPTYLQPTNPNFINPNHNPNIINPSHNPNFINPNHNIPTYLQPTNPTHFKKQRKNKRNRGKQHNNRPPESDRPPVSDIEWPCPPPPEPQPETYTAWPVLNLPKKAQLPSAEERARFSANQLQQKALKVAQEFFNGNSDDDSEDEDEDDAMEEDESEEFRFFMRVFIQDREMRGYYEKNYASGEFCCLVCGGIGQKIGKRFKDCVALVQHSISIAKTKKRRAHRAYGQAICRVLGWDINKLPTIVSLLVDPLNRCSAKSGDPQGNGDDGHKEDSNMLRENVDSVTVDNGGAVTVLNTDSNAGEVLAEKAVDLLNGVAGEVMVCENSLAAVDGSKAMEDLDQGVSNTGEGNAEGVVNHLCSNLSRTMLLEAVEMK